MRRLDTRGAIDFSMRLPQRPPRWTSRRCWQTSTRARTADHCCPAQPHSRLCGGPFRCCDPWERWHVIHSCGRCWNPSTCGSCASDPGCNASWPSGRRGHEAATRTPVGPRPAKRLAVPEAGGWGIKWASHPDQASRRGRRRHARCRPHRGVQPPAKLVCPARRHRAGRPAQAPCRSSV